MMDIDEEKFKEELYSKFPDFKNIKPNPNHWPIVTKYNNRIYRKYKRDLYSFIEKKVEAGLVSEMVMPFASFCERIINNNV